MSLFEELKRRNVFRVGVAYVVGAWLLLQLTEVLSELLTLPEQIGPIVVAMVAIGFPIVLFFAWAYEMTPQGIKRGKDVERSDSITRQTGRKLDRAIIAMLVVVAGYFIWESRFADRAEDMAVEPQTQRSGNDVESAPEQEPEPAPNVSLNRKSIAVLPFDNRSRLEEDEFFVEGIHDDLLTNLARIGDLKVISRTSMLRFKDTEKPIPEIAAELGVAAVMEGAVQRSGNTVRINVQLIDAATDEHLWAEIFDRQLTAENLFAIQSEISQSIANALQATLSPQEQHILNERPTENLAAYDAYLRGRQQMARRNAEGAERAQAEFTRAVELDPNFALAWAAMAENTRWLEGYSTLPPTEAIRLRDEAARQALQINPDLGEAYMALAYNNDFNEDFEAAELQYRKAIELSPGFAQAYDWYADFLQRFPARSREALAMIRKAEELDPLSPDIQVEIAEQLIFLGRYDAAERQLQRTIQWQPDYVEALDTLSGLMSQRGRFDEALLALNKAAELDPGNPSRYITLAFAYLDLGDQAALADLRLKIEEIDPQHWSLGWLEAVDNMATRNFAGALESSQWVARQFGDAAWFQRIFGFLHVLNQDYEQARRSFEVSDPGYFDRTTWRKALESNPTCMIPLVMANTGDEAMANDLLNLVINYLEYELPGYIDHADRYGTSFCHAMRGDAEKAISSFEVAVEHGHYQAWWLWLELPAYAAIRDDPRFVALTDEIKTNIAAQRARLKQIKSEAGP